MGSIKREPVPPGPIADLFDQLDSLHSQAGRPSMREIAIRAGRGKISSSTVHNIFRSSRVPRWAFLEQIVNALGGADDRDRFLVLWQAAWRAENEQAGAEPTRGNAAPRKDGDTGTGDNGISAAGIVGRADQAPKLAQRIWSNEIPTRNRHFTGREAELELIRENLSDGMSPHMQVIAGMGGIGKTELATEYVHRNIDKYEIIWWIRAEHHDRIREALVKLAQRLELRQASADRDRTIAAVLDRLQSEIRSTWLLVYDNAANPLDIQRYLPQGRPDGHIIITSRLLSWPGYVAAGSIEITPFTEQEAVGFLRRRVPGLAPGNSRQPLTDSEDALRSSEARRLAAELGHLPIAVDHAAAYLAETGQSIDEYLASFQQNAHLLLSEQPGDPEISAHVSGTWAVSTTLLTQDAVHLFNLSAFFSPEPIAAELLIQQAAVRDEPPGLREFLSSATRFRAAASQLHRLSLARVDGARDLIQMHRVVQAVTRGRLRQDHSELYLAYRSAVDALLAASNPGSPDLASNDGAFDLSLQHLESDPRFLHTSDPALRGLIIDQVRRLRLRGAHAEAMRFGEDAHTLWRETLGHDHIDVLGIGVEVAISMYVGGHAADAHELILSIRPLLQRYTDGEGLQVFLRCEQFYAEDLRARSQFQEALQLDLEILPKFEAAFGVDHERTQAVRSNIAIDYRQMGRYAEALQVNDRNLADRRRIFGPNDPVTLRSADAVARDLRSLGRYQESLDIARRVVAAHAMIGGRENTEWLFAGEGFATALRKAGHHWDALQEGEHVLQRYRDYLGEEHAYTLRAAASLVNARRAVGDLSGAEELAQETRERCLGSDCPDDLRNAALLNLASVLRVAGRPREALVFDEQARHGLIRLYGGGHPLTLAANINYAADLAGSGRLGDALQLGQETLTRYRGTLGESHPDTLMAGANLAIDEAAAGNQAAADQRLADVLRSYTEILTMEHPEARAAAQGIRLTAEIEPSV
ncbi:MAG: FxSxx-COOH system tetratricopeptide repeat protein [Trebonia sp.]